MLTTIQRSALVMHSAENMFRLVNDVGAYPEFMEGCRGSEILEEGEDYMVARLDLQKKGIKTSFVTHNRLMPFEKIALELHSGPFKQLRGAWTFKPLAEKACKVSFFLEFEANSQLVGVAANGLFASVTNSLVTSISSQADKVYGAIG
jgi:ribosome-associated toxin RatA of RatAB toxin-antitoxin module